ncbi:hypothetical protein [Stenotrophomonas lactitubi]|uniref:hypothetical protein n=1 Tax=Stenotrophomonas lactitubi TaxID=2045214 RepID=UPI003207909B
MKDRQAVGSGTQEVRSLDWGKLTVAATSIAAIGGVLMYWIGSTARSAYLAALGVPSEGFSLTRDALFELGAAALVHAASEFPHLIQGHPAPFIIFVAGIALVALIFKWPVDSSKLTRKRQLTPRKRAIAYAVLVAALLPMIGMMTSSFTLLIIAIPAAVGQSAGSSWAANIRREVCTPRATEPCVELWRDQARLGCGAVIAESSTRLAFLDKSSGLTRVLDIQGVETLGRQSADAEREDGRTCAQPVDNHAVTEVEQITDRAKRGDRTTSPATTAPAAKPAGR